MLALDIAARLGPKIKKLYLYEPPFIVDSSRPAMAPTLASEIRQQFATGDRNNAVKLFFSKGMGIPSFAVTLMRFLMPGWSSMCGMAQTIPYDLAILKGTQDGQPLPENRWNSVTAPIEVAVGGRSEPFFHNGAKALARMIPGSRYESIAGLHHGALLMAPAVLGRDIQAFFVQG